MKVHFDLCDHVQQGLDSLLCVVDGKKLLVTPLNIVKIPLPMSKSVINCSDYIVHVSITDLICVLTTNSFELYENEKLIGKYAVKGRQIWCTRDTIVVLGSDSDTDVLQVYKWKLIDDEFCLELDSVIETNGVSLGIVDMFSNSVLIQDLNGTIFKVLNKLDKIHQFPQKCCKIMATTVDGTRIMFGKSRSKLYNESLITDDCTSFAVSPKHLIYTTLSHETIFTDPLLLSKTSRRNERGAKILVLNTRIIIYKMPRGNFETIYPRPFIQTFITSLMDRKMYREAFIECRKHRVSFDHIVSESLVSDLPKFVECIESSEYLNLFLSSITFV